MRRNDLRSKVVGAKYLNKEFNRLTIRAIDYRKTASGRTEAVAICDCNCGTKGFRADLGNVVKHNTKSCGCLAEELVESARANPGESHSRLYMLWAHLKTRFTNRHHPRYRADLGPDYFSADWAQSFSRFKADVFPLLPRGETDVPLGIVLACEDDKVGFHPGNVRFVTLAVVTAKRASPRHARRIEVDGRSGTIREMAIANHLPPDVLRYRLKPKERGGAGLSPAEAVRRPLQRTRPRRR
jgi:hypothetical protein